MLEDVIVFIMYGEEKKKICYLRKVLGAWILYVIIYLFL